VDVGCVDHPLSLIGGQGWLHGAIAQVAASCIGVDTNAAGVKRMNELGYHALCADLSEMPAALQDHGPFDVVVAGELIEHLPSPQSLLECSKRVLYPGGKLIISTPNPYTWYRTLAGKRHIVFDNVDHVIFVFPSGIAEMADRTGLRLHSYTTVGLSIDRPGRLVSPEELGSGILAILRRRRKQLTPTKLLIAGLHVAIPKRLAETTVYILERPDR
jgi:SAM-dependent methyltransferase